VDAAARHDIEIRIEGGVGSNTANPDDLLELLRMTPGLKVTLDYSHFVFQGLPVDRMEPLVAHAGHVQCRGAALGRMQVPFEENAIDFGRMIDHLLEVGYGGFFSMEYVWMRTWDCDRTENTMETIRFRDFVKAKLEGRPFELQQPVV
jgi:sugar phosphate isomerase/epimerase